MNITSIKINNELQFMFLIYNLHKLDLLCAQIQYAQPSSVRNKQVRN